MSNKKSNFVKALIKASLMFMIFICMLVIFVANGEINGGNIIINMASMIICSDMISEFIYDYIATRKKKSEEES